MEISWKLFSLCIGLLFFQLCNGFPVNLENTAADSHAQLLTGLVAVLLTVCSIVFLAGCLCCQRKNGFKEFRDSPVVASTSSNLDHGHINPVANGEFTIFTPLSPPHQNNNVFLANQQIITRTVEDYGYGDVDVRSWFDGTEKDFPRIKLKYIRELGKGWFGKVVEGAANDENNAQLWNPVVVRILEATSNSRERVVFLHDAAIYRCGPHPNILALLGRCLDTVPLLLLQEYCPQGDLKKYLKENKVDAAKLLSTEKPIEWCCQLTSALKHLHDHKITHPDLAARNCQLTSNLTLKLGDYGLTIFQYPEDYYQGSPGVPVRWCSPESLYCTSTTIQPKKTTLEANVWSLGVTMWEIYECGTQPYCDLTDDEVVSQVFGSPNIRLTRPSFQVLYTDYIFRLMQLCWTSAESRPAVSQIDLMLADLLQVYKNTKNPSVEDAMISADDFDKRWNSFKPNIIVKTDNHVIEPHENEIFITKSPLSPSLNNLHGSLDNLLVDNKEPLMDSWLENVATKTDDLSYVRGLSEAINDLDTALALETTSSSGSSPKLLSKIEFKLGPSTSTKNTKYEQTNQNDSLTDSLIFVQRTSSESETEEENWRKKVERGAYTEKVRLKSRSVADLMVLTHVDYSESEPDTPLPSLDYRINYKNVRYLPKTNIETLSLTYGSEGNLLNVQDTFQDELRKLKEERRDSLLFVPDSHCQNNNCDKSNVTDETKIVPNETEDLAGVSPNKRLLEELNSPIEIKPSNQVYNVFNVTIDNFSPIHVNNTKLNQIINYKDNDVLPDIILSSKQESPEKLNKCVIENISEIKENAYPFETNSSDVIHSIKCQNINGDQHKAEKEIVGYVKDNFEYKPNFVQQKLSDSESKFNKNTDQNNIAEICENTNLQIRISELSEELENGNVEIVKENIISDNLISNGIISDLANETLINESNTNDSKENSVNLQKIDCVSSVPKLYDIIQNNDELMDYIIAKYENDSQDGETDVITKPDIIPEPINPTSASNEDSNDSKIVFDLSEDQEEAKPNSLSHSNVFSNAGFGKKSLQEVSIPSTSKDTYSSLNLYGNEQESNEHELASASFTQKPEQNQDITYSLETWGNFLENVMDNQNSEMFDSFSSEPQSLLFVETNAEEQENEYNSAVEISSKNEPNCKEDVPDILNKTFSVSDDLNETYVINENTELDNSECVEDSEEREWGGSGIGWFLHPQYSNEDISGEMVSQSSDSYVGFSMDDEIMAAIRNELLMKLPHAQGSTSDKIKEDEEWETDDKNEVFLRYNVYNTPLSPILEESYIDDSGGNTPKLMTEDEEDESDWSEQAEPGDNEILQADTESRTAPTLESPIRGFRHRHTPSQDSCCSNDTLFNLEELTCGTTDPDKDSGVTTVESKYDLTKVSNEITKVQSLNNVLSNNSESDINLEVKMENNSCRDKNINACEINNCFECVKSGEFNEISGEVESSDSTKCFNITNKSYINDFLVNEREFSAVATVKLTAATSDESTSETPSSSTGGNLGPFINKSIAPLPSPEDKPWKQLPASMLNFDTVLSQNNSKLLPASTDSKNVIEPENDLPINTNIESQYVNVSVIDNDEVKYENSKPVVLYENIDDIYNEADYVNIVNLENSKNSAEYSDHKDNDEEMDMYDGDLIINNDMDDSEIFGVLTDIRFNGPADSQLMSTSFSESNDLNDDEEQDWDSGSDTRSSSSGEFIWKEGEHEESLKALRAAPQDLEDISPIDEIAEETLSKSSTVSSSDDEEGETPEFVPSAWDKYAIPVKSALRSPEKTLDAAEKKQKAVWFKKQKYHCVYEYPREPESPVLQSHDLWKPQSEYAFGEWEFDADTYLPPPTDQSDILKNSFSYQPKPNSRINLYQLSVSDLVSNNSSSLDDEFYISGSATPFDMIGNLSSQFFPGNTNWNVENMTPDSGMEDITPGSLIDDYPNILMASVPIKTVESLKTLAADVVNRTKQKSNDVLGGLRHTRNKLKLDLPPSPNAFSSGKTFTVEATVLDPIIREKPTFSTFGKSRFLVQHVDTPPDDELSKSKNVSFEAIPYKPLELGEDTEDRILLHKDYINSKDFLYREPMEKVILKEDVDVNENKAKVEFVRGEASLLDSADEDSGIESTSTLERKLCSSVE